MKLLIIEDDPKTARNLSRGLEESGFAVEIAADGETGVCLASSGAYDVILLDVMLPGVDGWSLLAELRRRRTRTPVLMITARDAVQDRVRGLDLGADDYLTKPFEFSELLARIRAVLRRGSDRSDECWRIGDLELDWTTRRVARGGVPLDLTPKEFVLLSLFVRRAGEVLSRQLIADHVWGIDFSCDSNVIEVHVRRLRAKLDGPFENKLLHTVRGFGYMLGERP